MKKIFIFNQNFISEPQLPLQSEHNGLCHYTQERNQTITIIIIMEMGQKVP